MNITEGVLSVTMTTLKPMLVTAVACVRYFARQETKAERTKQAVLDVEMIFDQLGIADPTKPVK